MSEKPTTTTTIGDSITAGAEWVYDNGVVPVAKTLTNGVTRVARDLQANIEARASVFGWEGDESSKWRKSVDKEKARISRELDELLGL